jgi:Tfp pilus assembly protein PilF
MSSTTEQINAYVDLISSSLDADTIEQPDFRYIVAHIGREDFAAAERRCLLRVQNHGDDYLSWALYGLSLMLQAEVKSAGEALQRAMQIEPENVLVLNLMGDFLCCAGRYKEGEDAYWYSLSKQEGQVHPRKMLYFQFMVRKEYQKALDVLIPALRTCSDDENTWSSIRIALGMIGSHDYAEEVSESLTKEFPDQHLAWQFKAHVYLATKDPARAEVAAKRAIELKRDDALNWNILGTVLNISGRHKAAIKCQQKAVNLEPKIAMYWTSLGLAFLKAGNRSECQRTITKATALDPEAAMGLLQHLMKERK